MPLPIPPIPSLPPDLQAKVNSELEPGESLVWVGQPGPRALPGCLMVFLILFGLVFTSFALFWTIGAGIAVSFAAGSYGWLTGLFGVPFILAGLAIITSPFWMRRNLAKTVYLLTNRRAVIVEPTLLRGTTVHSYHPDRLTSITRTERPDGSGDLILEQFTTHDGSGHTTTRRGFMAIPNVRQVESLLNHLTNTTREQRNNQIDRPT